jgi:hypothetical protein
MPCFDPTMRGLYFFLWNISQSLPLRRLILANTEID